MTDLAPCEAKKVLFCKTTGTVLDILKAHCHEKIWSSCAPCEKPTCEAPSNILGAVKERCQNKGACTLSIDLLDLDQVCFRRSYLQVTYNCVSPATTDSSIFSRTSATNPPTTLAYPTSNDIRFIETSWAETTFAETTPVMTGSVEEISLATGKDGKIGHILIPSSPDGVVIEETTVITGQSSSLDPAITATIWLIGAVALLLLISTLFYLRRRMRKRSGPASKAVGEEIQNELYGMRGQFERDQREEKLNELYQMDGGGAD